VIGRIESHVIWLTPERSGFQFERIIRLEDFNKLIDALQPNPRLRRRGKRRGETLLQHRTNISSLASEAVAAIRRR